MTPEWTAQLIAPATRCGGEGDPAIYLRREFEVTDAPIRATLRVTAVGVIEPHLNGQAIGDEVLTPGWTSYHHRLLVSSHDVTARIRPGTNAVAAVLGQGWALGRLGWENVRNHYADQPAAFLQLELEGADGTVTVIGSDAEFRSATGGVRAHSIYDGEDFDARLEPAGWDEPGFDDHGWKPVEVSDRPLGALAERTGEPIRRVEELTPVEIIRTPAGRTVVDFGQNLSGWVRLRGEGPAGSTVTLRHAEVMTGGEVDTETNRTAQATDRYTFRGEGVEVWEPRFTFHGFRYVEVEGWPGALERSSLTAIVVHSDMRRIGWLETSDPMLNQLHSNAVWSMRGNFVGIPTDCPQRDERLGWTGDINAFAPAAAFLYDVRGVLGSWLKDLAIEQRETGNVPWVVPDVLSTPSSPTALWSDVAVNLPWVLYQQYGDEQILRDSYPSATAFVRQVRDLLDDGGLWSTGFQYGDWLDPDAPIDNPAGGKTDRHLVASAYLCRTTQQIAQIAQILGELEDAAEFEELERLVRRAFRREYVTPRGRVVNESATAYALAICFDILDDDQLAHAGERLAALVAGSGYRISTGFAGTPLVTDALSRTGHLDEAYLLLTEKSCPSFLYPITMGATTIWERWDSIRPDGTLNPSGMTSLNHYALGAVVDWMHRVIGGVTALLPGYRRTRIAPQPGGGLTSATLEHATPLGDVKVSWQIAGGTLRMDVTIPEGMQAEVVLPRHPDSVTVEAGTGSHAWTYELLDDERPAFDLDTPLRTLAADPATWHRVTAVFAEHLPGIPIDGNAPEAAAMSLTTVLEFIPGASDALALDLEAAVRRDHTAPADGAIA